MENPWAPGGFARKRRLRDGSTHFSDFFCKSLFSSLIILESIPILESGSSMETLDDSWASSSWIHVRPFKTNCMVWVTSLVPFAITDRKTRANYKCLISCAAFFSTARVFLPRSLVPFGKNPDSNHTIYFKWPNSKTLVMDTYKSKWDLRHLCRDNYKCILWAMLWYSSALYAENKVIQTMHVK